MIAALAPFAQRALLVERDEEGPGVRGEGEALLRKLEPWCVVEARRSEWPGTRLFGHTALVREYTLSPEVVSALQSAVDGLYGWIGDLPEDLSLVRSNGEALLFGISHEKDGGVALSPEERDELLRACPGLGDCVRWHDPGTP